MRAAMLILGDRDPLCRQFPPANRNNNSFLHLSPPAKKVFNKNFFGRRSRKNSLFPYFNLLFTIKRAEVEDAVGIPPCRPYGIPLPIWRGYRPPAPRRPTPLLFHRFAPLQAVILRNNVLLPDKGPVPARTWLRHPLGGNIFSPSKAIL